jgi:hypothetical protein
MGGFFSMEQNARRNNGPNLEKGEGGYGARNNSRNNSARNGTGAVAPRVNNNNRGSVNVEVANNGTRRNNGNNRNTSRRNNASSRASDPRELEEVVVSEPSTPPPNTVVNINRSAPNNGRINVVATNVQAPLPANTTPEGEEQVGGKRRRKSRKSRKSRRKSRKNRK